MVVSLLLCIALAGTIFAAASTVQAYQQFQQKHQRVQAGDVSTISSWMTLPEIARIYHVPAGCLDESLYVSLPRLQRYATLGYIALSYKEPVNTVIREVQHIILDYRAKRLVCDTSQIKEMVGPWRFLMSDARGSAYE